MCHTQSSPTPTPRAYSPPSRPPASPCASRRPPPAARSKSGARESGQHRHGPNRDRRRSSGTTAPRSVGRTPDEGGRGPLRTALGTPKGGARGAAPASTAHGNMGRQVADDQDNTRRGVATGPHAHGNAARYGRPGRGVERAANTVKRPPQQPAQPPVRQLLGPRYRGTGTTRNTGRSGRQNAVTRRSTRREEGVAVQGPVKEPQPDGMSHVGGGGVAHCPHPRITSRFGGWRMAGVQRRCPVCDLFMGRAVLRVPKADYQDTPFPKLVEKVRLLPPFPVAGPTPAKVMAPLPVLLPLPGLVPGCAPVQRPLPPPRPRPLPPALPGPSADTPEGAVPSGSKGPGRSLQERAVSRAFIGVANGGGCAPALWSSPGAHPSLSATRQSLRHCAVPPQVLPRGLAGSRPVDAGREHRRATCARFAESRHEPPGIAARACPGVHVRRACGPACGPFQDTALPRSEGGQRDDLSLPSSSWTQEGAHSVDR